MTDQQWRLLTDLVNGRHTGAVPVGLLVDGPWLSDWAGVSLMQYYTHDETWLEVNRRAVERFPDVMFLAGFWAEFGMISNPPAFGTKCIWPETGFPTAEKIIYRSEDVDRLVKPNVRTDGMLPFLMNRLKNNQNAIEKAGHRIRFASTHGPLTIASYLLGHTEMLMATQTEPDMLHHVLSITTEFVIDWVAYQSETFSSIDGILVLEDLMGFLGPQDFETFALPYMQKIFDSFDGTVKFLHNDAHGLITAKYLKQLGVNLFNFSFKHRFEQIRELAGDSVVLMGNIPPRDLLAQGSCEDIRGWVVDSMEPLSDRSRILISAGGFVSQSVASEKIEAIQKSAAMFSVQDTT